MRHTKNYLQHTDTSHGPVTCQVDIFRETDRQVAVLLSQHSLSQPALDPYPEIATMVHAREGFQPSEEITWYHDCAVRVSRPTLWQMNLKFVAEGWPWRKTYRWAEAGLHTAMMDRAPFFRSLGIADPLVAIQDNAAHDEAMREELNALLYGRGTERGWLDERPTEPRMMRGLLRLADDRLEEIADSVGEGEWLFMVQVRVPDKSEPEKTLHRATTISALHTRMLLACDEAEQRPGAMVSFAPIAEPWRKKEYPDWPVEVLG